MMTLVYVYIDAYCSWWLFHAYIHAHRIWNHDIGDVALITKFKYLYYFMGGHDLSKGHKNISPLLTPAPVKQIVNIWSGDK